MSRASAIAEGGVVIVAHQHPGENKPTQFFEISSDNALALSRELEAAAREAHQHLIEKAQRDT